MLYLLLRFTDKLTLQQALSALTVRQITNYIVNKAAHYKRAYDILKDSAIESTYFEGFEVRFDRERQRGPSIRIRTMHIHV